ncbi:MAG: glycosyltransferase family 2 protein [Deltaproteobacteria bacterium]|nr:glycosyltransferase family 2 protein [Deltaproteobacteria bacterium]
MRGLTVFCPVYNEEALIEGNLARLVDFLEKSGIGPFEVIIGENGSTDQSPRILEALCRKDDRISWFHLDEKEVGTAFSEGIRRARYERFVTVDMDLSIDLDFINRAVSLLETHDIVIGSKIMGNQKRPWLRKSVSNLFIILARFLLGIGFHDYSIAAKAYRTASARRYLDFLDKKTFYVVIMVHLATADGLKITEIPVSCHDMRESRFNLLHEGVYKFGNLFLLFLRSVVLRKRG